MISAAELRIGNYVASDHFKDRDVIVKVRLIGQEQAIVEHPNGLTEPMLYQGEMRAINLTEEILLKCGYTESQLETGRILIVESGGFIIRQLSDRVVVNHLHQLQNLYFALTGKELEVKL